MAGDVKISVIATGFDASRPLKRIEQPIHRRQVEPKAIERTPVPVGAAVTTADKPDEKKYDPNDLEVPSFLRRR
jgi:hypothetical protein